MSSVFIDRTTINRLLHDVKYIYTHTLHEHGIYYIHDEENIMKGYALLIGPINTPYQYGYNLFSIDYPKNYPSSPPKFNYINLYLNGDNIRMHPNMYRNGKVCISILNTWFGSQWSSCQTISSVLLSLISIFDENPLLNEPGITNRQLCLEYHTIITYKNILTILQTIKQFKEKKDIMNNVLLKFKDVIIQNYDKNKLEIYDTIIDNVKRHPNTKKYECKIYNMLNINISFKSLLEIYESIT